nr:hypothetical protein [Bacteroidota bacterium]
LLFLILTWSGLLSAQNPIDLKIVPDSAWMDSLAFDSLRPERAVVIVMSPDSIDAPVEYGSVDSNYLDNGSRRVYLYGKAFVKYKDLQINADYIVVDLDSSIATAEGLLDSVGKLANTPVFTIGDETIKAQKMRYNFKTRKGFIYNVLLEEGDLLIHGEKTKYVAAGATEDSTDPVLYNAGALITSCNAEHPHYGIRARKVKTIPDKLAVVGASHLEIFGIPTPLWLPFGFYPVPESRQAGIIFPRDFEQSRNRGFGIKEVGYYFPHRDWADVRITGDIYFNGSWGLGVNTNYIKKYKFRGAVDLRYSNLISEPPGDYRPNKEKSFSIRLTHAQDSKAHPYQTIGGSINIQSNDFESLNYNDAQSVLNSSYSSNFSYNRTFPGKPYSLSAGLTHSQNTQSHLVTINAPELNFRLNRIYPFKVKDKPGQDQWYEKIAFQYTGSARSQIAATDTTLFDKETWDNFQYGAQHKANANVNFNVLKYFNFTPSIDYGETWFVKSRDYDFLFDPNDSTFVKQRKVYYPDSSAFYIVNDTINSGKINPLLTNNFNAFRTFNTSINMNTQIFGTMQFKKGWLRGFRHVMKPSIGFSYSPSSPDTYFEYSKFSAYYPDSLQRLSKFDRLLYSVNPVLQEQANINYSVNNIFEAKYFSKRDSIDKKLKLFDNIAVNGNYNIAADSFQFSPLNIGGNTRLFKGITTITLGATYSFYGLRSNGRLNSAAYWVTDHKPVRFDNVRLRFSSSITFAQVLGLFNGKTREQLEEERDAPKVRDKLPTTEEKFFDLLNSFSFHHEFYLTRLGRNDRDTTQIVAHTVNMTGSMRITPNWSINFSNIGYDFKSKELTYPDIGIARDLHCWELAFSFQPTRGTYTFHLGVKPGSFDFLKFPVRRGTAFQGF